MPITLEQNEESWWLRQDDGDTNPRICFTIHSCPCEEYCSADSWKRVKCWSWISADAARSYLARHLCKSSNHDIEEHEAIGIAAHADVEEVAWRYADLVEGDRRTSNEDKRKRLRPSAKAPPHHGPRQPPHPPPPVHMNRVLLQEDYVCPALRPVIHEPPSSSSQRSDGATEGEHGTKRRL